MALCSSINALLKQCAPEGVVAGLEAFYIISYADLAPASGTAGSPTYATATNGLVSDIGLKDTKKFVEIALIRSTSGIEEEGKIDLPTNSQWFEQKATLVLSDLTVENRAFVMSVLSQPVAILTRTRTGKYIVAGLNGLFQLSSVKTGTGLKEGDLTGYTLEFSGIDTKPVMQVDPTIVSGLIA
jgi:hypothetical protein